MDTPRPIPIRVPPEVAAAPASDRFGRYVRMKKLGAGGMGEVWKAWDTSLGRWVALKIPKNTDEEESSRFIREAQLAGQLSHPNIAAIYEVGEEAGRLFIAMQYVEGVTMRNIEATPRELAIIFRDAARALDFAHEHRIVHRDLKPENLMVSQATNAGEWHVYVMDFGLARTPEGQITLSGAILGTPSYMPPEQAQGDQVDGRCDVWSLGATLYDMLAGRPPFLGPTPVDTLTRVLADDVVPPRRYDPAIDTELETIVLKCLEKDPARRYATARDLADDLDRWLDGEAILARRPSIAYRMRKTIGRHRAAFGVGSVAVLVVIAILAWPFLGAELEQRRERAALAARIAASHARLKAITASPDAAAADRLVADLEPLAAKGEPHPLAQARLIAARARAKAGAAALADFARAYAAARTGDPDELAAAAEALLEIGAIYEKGGDFERARTTYRTFLARFAGHAATDRVRFREAAASESMGDLPAALHRFESVIASGTLPAADLARSRQSVAIIRSLLPAVESVIPMGRLTVGDTDGDGRAEVALYEFDGRLSVHAFDADARISRVAEGAVFADTIGLTASVTIADVDGDGRPEIIATWGNAERQLGGVDIYRREKSALVQVVRIRLPTFATVVRVADLDGDRRPEIVVGVGYFVRRLDVYRLLPGPRIEQVDSLTLNPASDFLDILPGDFHPDAGQELAIASGPWSHWTLWIARWRPGRLERVAALDRPVRATNLRLLPGGRLAFFNGFPPEEATALKKSAAAPPGDPLAAGVYAVSLDEGRFGAPELLLPAGSTVEGPLAIAPLVLDGKTYLAACLAGDEGAVVRRPLLHALDGGPWRAIIDGFGNDVIAADLDGDGGPELVTTLLQGGQLLVRVHGLGRAAPAPPTDAQALAIQELAPGHDLLALGLYEPAAEVFRARGDSLGVGLALMALQRWSEAATEFGRVTGRRRTEALKRRAACYQEMRDWPAMASALDELAQTIDLDPLDRRDVLRKRGIAREAAALVERGRLTTLAEGPTFLCENPYLCRRRGGDLDFIDSPPGHAGAGVPLRYGGGPFRLEWDLRFDMAQWSCDGYIGIDGPAQLCFAIRLSGESAAPMVRSGIHWNTETTRVATSWFKPDAFRPEIGRSYRVAIEYVPEFALARLTIKGGDTDLVTEVALPEPLPPGLYRFGKGSYAWGSSPVQTAMVYSIRDVRLLAYAPATHFDRLEAKTPDDHLWVAGGAWVLGRHADAERLYTKALELCGPLDGATVTACLFFRGLLRIREGDLEEGRADLLEAVRKNGKAAEKLYDLSFAGMTEVERALFKK